MGCFVCCFVWVDFGFLVVVASFFVCWLVVQFCVLCVFVVLLRGWCFVLCFGLWGSFMFSCCLSMGVGVSFCRVGLLGSVGFLFCCFWIE